MQKPIVLAVCLLPVLSCSLAVSATITNTGSATLTCFNPNPPGSFVTEQFVGPVLHGGCPADYFGGQVSGGSGGSFQGSSISTSAGGGVQTVGLGSASYQFHGGMQDTITETGGTGQGTEQFNIVFDWFAVDDFGSESVLAEFFYNGEIRYMDGAENLGISSPFYHEDTMVLRVPFTYGQPFTIEEDVMASGSAFGSSGYASSSGNLTVTHFAPEPGTLAMLGLAFLVGAGMKARQKLALRRQA